MRCVIDIEANGLEDPTEIWCIVAKDIDTGQVYTFKEVTKSEDNKKSFRDFCNNVDHFIGHNWLGYDAVWIANLLNASKILLRNCTDTLIISKMADYSRPEGHSLEAYGKEFNIPKGTFTDFSKYSEEMLEYCKRDVEITHKVYLKYLYYIEDSANKEGIKLEHSFQDIVNSLHSNGFAFNTSKATTLLNSINKELSILDTEILKAFPKKLRMVREVHPVLTKHGTLHKKDFRFVTDGDLSEYNGGPFCRCTWEEFNPSSHKQLIDVLHAAGWKPTDKTKTHIELERDLQRLRNSRLDRTQLDIKTRECYGKLEPLKKYGYKINEQNLSSLPEDAPAPARSLAKRILLESRRRTLTEWLSLVAPDGRIHGKFYGIGAWTQRMAHQSPNTANIPTAAKLYGEEMRSLWRAPKNRLLVGVDAEGIQLRIFAHYIDDPEFTKSLVEGRKDDKTDPHSLNARVLGSVCANRQVAKRFIYALLLGAGIDKLAEILECSRLQAEEALSRILERYTGFAKLKQEIIPSDAKRGAFYGLDGRLIPIPGSDFGYRKHLAMSGYLQAGEAIVMKKACLLWHDMLKQEGIYKAFIVNFVHDEWQTEGPNNVELAIRVAQIQADAIRIAGEQLNLKCPLAGSYWNEDRNDYTIGTNWSVTH